MRSRDARSTRRRNSRRPRVVSAASQLGSPRGRSCRPPPTLAPGLPRCSASVRSPVPVPPGGGPVRFVHRTGSCPVRLPGRRGPRARRSGTRLAFTGLRIVRTRARDCKGEFAGGRGTVRAGGRRLARALRADGRRRARRDPARARRRDGQRRGGRRGVAGRRAARARRARAARCSGSTRACRSRSRGPLSYSRRRTRPHHDLPRSVVAHRARDDADLAAHVRVTVLHEVGHYFGMSDERLASWVGRSAERIAG